MASSSLNVTNFVTLKLKQTNYPLWRAQLLSLAESQDLSDHLTAEFPEDQKFVAAPSPIPENYQPQLSDNFKAWQKSDRLLRGWIYGTLSEESLGLVIGLETVKTVWEALKDAYAQDSQEREFNLRQQLSYFRKDESKTITEHLRLFKEICDNLTAIGKTVPDNEKVFCLLTSLGPQFEDFTTTMLKPPRPTFTELISQLKSLEQRRTWFMSQSDASMGQISSHVAFYGNQQRQPNSSSSRRSNFTSQGRGFQAQQPRGQNQGRGNSTTQRRTPPSGHRRMTAEERELYKDEVCQYCGKPGHIAKICWWIPKSPQENLPQALAALTLDNGVVDADWIADSGASHHMTGNKFILDNFKEYSGMDSIAIGDGSSLSINGIGSTSIKQKHCLPVSDVLVVPDLKQNLLSISQITDDFPVNCEFSNKSVCVKDRKTGQILLTGPKKHNLYTLSAAPKAYFSNRFKAGTAVIWHQRLGHPQASAVSTLSNKRLIDVRGSVQIKNLCDSCQLGKLSRFPFSSSVHSSSCAFDKIHCDLWGPAPVLSIEKFRYYACFVDDFTKYCWIIPLKQKSDFFATFLAFEKFVFRQFGKNIKVFHSDGGGEFVNSALSSHFLANGIKHQISCPYTPEQTGMVERRHRVIRELGMTMLFHGHLPLFLWVEAFQTAVFLLNRLPSDSLQHNTPFYMLNGYDFDYSSLRVFGSKCFPYIWDTKRHKFDPKSCLCVFVGYSDRHKGYKCYNPTTRKFIISRHVSFDEQIFPYKSSVTDSLYVSQVMNPWVNSSSTSSVDEATSDNESSPILTVSCVQGLAESPGTSDLPPQNVLNEITPFPSSSDTTDATHELHVDSAFNTLSAPNNDAPSDVSPSFVQESPNIAGLPTAEPRLLLESVASEPVTAAATAGLSAAEPQLLLDSDVSDPVTAAEAVPLAIVAPAVPASPDFHSSATETEHIDEVSNVALGSHQSPAPASVDIQCSAAAPSDGTAVAVPAGMTIVNSAPRHTMVTRSQLGIVKPNPRYALSVTLLNSIPREPKTVKAALAHDGWRQAMVTEIDALHRNNTWDLVPYRDGLHIIGCKWVFKAKIKPDGTLDRLKARLVAKGFHQLDGVDYTETYSPVIKPGTIRTVLTVALVKKWPIRQLDVTNAFLHGYVTEDLFMEQPPGMKNPDKPTHVCKLKRALYGLKQAPRAWFDRLSKFLIAYGFFCSLADPSLFVFYCSNEILVLLVYVDDMLLTGSSVALVDDFIQVLHAEFSMKDLGPIHHFLGVKVDTTATGLHLSQTHYAYSILERAQMVDCQPMPTPLDLKHNPPIDSEPLSDPTSFRGIVGSLQYLTLTRPDLSFSVNFVSQFMHSPTHAHLKYVRRILRYLKGTIHYGLNLRSDTTLALSAFSDADWAGCPTTRRSTTGYCTFLGSNIISWCAKKQSTVARSSTEAEYRAMAHTAAELTWLGYILSDLRIFPPHPPKLFADNVSALFLTVNPVFHARSKHIALDYHYVRERVAQGALITQHIPSTCQLADVFTKSVPKARLAFFRHKLCLQPRHSLRGDIDQGSDKDVFTPWSNKADYRT